MGKNMIMKKCDEPGGCPSQGLQRPPTFLSNATSAYAVVRYPGSSRLGHLNEIKPEGSITPVPGIDGSRSLSQTIGL